MISEHKLTVVDIDANKWLAFYNENTHTLLCEPFCGSGSYTCADVLIVADSFEECKDYIVKKNIINPFIDINEIPPEHL